MSFGHSYLSYALSHYVLLTKEKRALLSIQIFRYVPYEDIAKTHEEAMYNDIESSKAKTKKNGGYPPLPFPGTPKEDESCSQGRHEKRHRSHTTKQKESRSQIQTESYQATPAQAKQKCEQEQGLQYKLGEKLRSRKHIIGRRADGGWAHLKLLSQLQPNDGAFIKRTDGNFTKAYLIRRDTANTNDEETLVFLVNSSGSTKNIPERKWKTCIRVERSKKHEQDESPRCVKERIVRSFSQDMHTKEQFMQQYIFS